MDETKSRREMMMKVASFAAAGAGLNIVSRHEDGSLPCLRVDLVETVQREAIGVLG